MAQVDVTGETGKHTGEITALVFDNEHVYSGGEDGVINVRLSFIPHIGQIHSRIRTCAAVSGQKIQLFGFAPRCGTKT